MVLVTGYKVEKRIKDGGFSSVYKGTRISDGKVVALKMVSEAGLRDRAKFRMFKREVDILGNLKHHYIVDILEYVTEATRPTIAMDYFDSENLKTRVMRGDQVIKSRFIKIFATICEALQFLHENKVVHKDIKPENILVNDEGETRLIDFSLAVKQDFMSKLFGSGRKVQGTPLYMSPEQIRNKALDVRSDIYSLGCTVYEVLTRRPPHMAQSQEQLLLKHLKENPSPPSQKDKNIPEDINIMVMKMLHKNPDKRPQTPAEILDLLHTYET